MRRNYLPKCHSCEGRNPVLHFCGVRCPHLTQNWRYLPFQPGFKRSVTWRVYNWRFIVTILSVLTFYVSTSFADTTWVAGTVSGVWGRRGNPYIVTDTLTIPQNSTLQIMPGVQIYFQNQQIRRTPIDVLGRLIAIGEEGDSIYFFSPVASFWGIENRIPGSVIHMEYCLLDSVYDGIDSNHGRLVIRHTCIRSYQPYYYDIICGDSETDTIQYCKLYGTGVNFSYGGPTVFQNNHCSTLVILGQQMAPITDNTITSYFYADYSAPLEIYNNVIAFVSLFETNGYVHNNNIQGCFDAFDASITFEQNESGCLDINNCYGVVRANVINSAYYGNDDACFIWNCSNLIFEKNLILSISSGVMVWSGDNNIFQNNSIAFGDYGIHAMSTGNQTQITNNIFLGNGVNTIGINSTQERDFLIKYNDFFQVNAATYNCQLDTGNILLDPCFRAGNPYDYQLQANSPCIDAGDPTSPLDPDGTRADMGCYFFDHRIDNPPAIISPFVVNVQRGTMLRYIAKATDDFGPMTFEFWNLPSWLQEESTGLDWVADSAAVSGQVPYNQENFTFGVWVEDGSAQRDSQEVNVLVSQYTILAGEVVGVLTLENSPYIVVQDVIVPAGDSLVIEPGVEIRFQWEPIEDLRHRIIVRGKLNAIGTSEDTIYFLPEFGDSLEWAWRGIQCVGYFQDTSHIAYTHLTNGYFGVLADSHATIIVEHSRIMNTYYGISAFKEAWVGLDSCNFYESCPGTFSSVFIDSATASIMNSNFENPQGEDYGTHIFFWDGSHGEVQGCVIIGGWGCKFDESCHVNFILNTVLFTDQGVYLSNHSNGIIANNILCNGMGLQLALVDSTLVSNNVFYDTEKGIRMQTNDPGTLINNNIFLNNQIAIEMHEYYPPFTNISYNDFFDNDSDFANCAPDSTNLYFDPMVQDTLSFRLSLGSPCIDAGDPNPFFNDVDSTRNDIGCWGGPWGESYPYSPVLSHQTKPLPTEFALLPPYPNPFNSVLVIPFTIPVQKEVIINIYNILGQKVQEFTFPPLSPGVRRVVWNSGSCASGLYVIRLISDGKEFKQKALLLK